jgi:hypothetical protein
LGQGTHFVSPSGPAGDDGESGAVGDADTDADGDAVADGDGDAVAVADGDRDGDGDAVADGDEVADGAAVGDADSGAAAAPDSDAMARTPITAATIPERAVAERRLNVIISRVLSAELPARRETPRRQLWLELRRRPGWGQSPAVRVPHPSSLVNP